MKAKLIYNLPEEDNDLRLAQNGSKYFCTLWDIKNCLRNYEKYDISIDRTIMEINELLYDINWDEIE